MLEAILLLFLTLFAIFGLAALAYWAVLLPLKQEIKELKERVSKQSEFTSTYKPDYYVSKVPVPNLGLPDMDKMSDSAWNVDIGNWGDADVTPETASDDLDDLEKSTTTAKDIEEDWRQVEALKHGRPKPLFYSGR